MESAAIDKKITFINFAKVAFFVLAAVYFLARVADRNSYGFFDNVDLVFHEAGHVIFSLFGEIAGVAGGTIMQLLVPLALVFYFFVKNDRYSAGLVTLWLGQSCANVARYAADAVELKLPLLGDGMHDWTYMLSLTNSLGRAAAVSDGFYYSGIAIIMAGIIIGILSFKRI